MRSLLKASLALLTVVAPARAQQSPLPIFGVADVPWDTETLGNHRAVVEVTTPGRVAHVVVAWRRPDRDPDRKGVLVVDAATGRQVANVRRGVITQEAGEFAFEPVSGPGRYFIYYLPFTSGGRSNYPNVTYLPPVSMADSSWLAATSATAPEATVLRLEAVDSLNAFWPMETIATGGEVRGLLAAYPGSAYLVFPEDREHAIRMRDQLPVRWTEQGPTRRFTATARRGEWLAFQLGVYALQSLRDVRVTFSDLRGPRGTVLRRDRLVSINTGGTNWDGRPFTKRVDVSAGAVQAMWCGLDVPRAARPGIYTGTATVSVAGMQPTRVALAITVGADSVLDGGADEPEKLTRLAWLNSTRGQANDVIAPYTPIRVSGHTLEVLGRRIVLGPSGLPSAIETFFTPEMTGMSPRPTPVLAAPMRFVVDGAGSGAGARTSGVRFTRRDPGTVEWTATTRGPAHDLVVRGMLEFDGHLSYQVRLRAHRRLPLEDVRLEIPWAPGAATLAMGLGLTGQRRPASYDWTWDVATKNQDALWLGSVNAGLYVSLRSDNYVRPLNTNFYLQKPLELPPSWGNGGRGGLHWREVGDTVLVRATSGPRTMAPGDSLRYDLVMLVTPFHPIDPEYQWSHRFYHRYAPLDTIAAAGATVVNVHHATAINPYINYPFIAHDTMQAYIAAAHRRGLDVKIYNTVRELSNRAYETFALRSLGHEVYSPGKGGGYAWLQEHLRDDYIAAWFVPELKDAAVVNSGMSRWHNYYVEGINWLVQRMGIDGLYLDDVAFDRTTMKRVKRMLRQAGRPGIVDLHSANQYNPRDGFINSAMLYMEHFPYLDRLWFGEYFDYEHTSPDFFLTEVSGIPFGLMGEMLEGGGNPWRGLLYGMTNRMPWSENADPRPIWKLWGDFGIRGSTMLGYWAPSVPVTTGRPDLLATVYRRDGRALVAVASWAADTVPVRLTIDWTALGLSSATGQVDAPAIRGMQEARRLTPGDTIDVAPGKGVVLLLH